MSEPEKPPGKTWDEATEQAKLEALDDVALTKLRLGSAIFSMLSPESRIAKVHKLAIAECKRRAAESPETWKPVAKATTKAVVTDVVTALKDALPKPTPQEMESMARFKTALRAAAEKRGVSLYPSEQRVLEERHAFSLRYAKAKGWPPPPKLNDEQVEELMRQPEWKEASKWLMIN